MFRQLLTGAMVVWALGFGLPLAAVAQQTTTAKEDAKKAGAEAKEAGKATGQAAKDAGKATVKGTTHVAKKTGRATKHLVHKTETSTKHVAKTAKRKVTHTRTVCTDGTVEIGVRKSATCADHGGIKR